MLRYRIGRILVYGIDNYIVFVLSGILLNLAPGNDTIYILTRSIAQGRKAGVFSVLGISSGGLTHTLLASLGLSVVLGRSIVLFNFIKFVGAGYLIYMGVRAFTSKTESFGIRLPWRKASIAGKYIARDILPTCSIRRSLCFFSHFCRSS